MKSLKTPLRWPGGKSRACTKMDSYFPDLGGFEEFREPFLGGGSVAIHITKKYPNLKIWVNDLYEPLYNFWCVLRDIPEELSNSLEEYKLDNNTPDKARELFNQMKFDLNQKESHNVHKAVAFYIVNKCSFSGLTESSSFSSQASISNFSLRGIKKLIEYSKLIQKWKITNLSYEDLLVEGKNTFIYLDPPYDIKDNLYGNKGSMHKGFDHDKFALDCDNCSMKQLVSYNSDQIVRDRFYNWNAAEFDLTYTMRSVGEYMRNQRQRKELLLFNYGIEGLDKIDQ